MYLIKGLYTEYKELPWRLSGRDSASNATAAGSPAGLAPGLGRSSEEDMATHSNVIAWRIPWTEEPGGLQSIGSQRVGYDLAIQQQQQHTEYTKNFQNSAVRKHTPTHQQGRLSQRFEEPLYQGYADGK